ncbi:exported hypothetical protein [Candidatus Sulfopaludibacter sp. SbA3]|nr:exported hypothetical protein [Candidatus Sulfopaludibacter sp. SbA3]
MIKRILTFLLLASAAFGQINSNSTSVTVTATLGQNVSPDQIGISVTVESAVTATLADVLAALQGTVLTPVTFSSVYSTQQYTTNGKLANPLLEWTFQLAVPLANMKSQVAALQALKMSLSQGQTPLTLSYSVQGPQTSTQVQVQSCALSDLVAAARTKAQQIAGAANLKAGNVVALSSSVTTMIGPSAPTPYVIPTCSLTATFALSQQTASTLSVSASRTVNAPPDLVVLSADVNPPVDATFNDILAALAGTGITAANLVDVYGDSVNTHWMFSLAVPFSKMKDAIAALQQAASQQTVTVSYSVQGTQVSAQLLAAQDCSNASLLADAQAQARKVAAAASVGLGGIVAISDGGLPSASGIFAFTSGAPYAIYDPLYGGPLGGVLGIPNTGCSISVQFGITQ